VVYGSVDVWYDVVMVRNLWMFLRTVFGSKKSRGDRLVGYSVKKYMETYKLLEDYDRRKVSEKQILVDSGRLRKVVQRFQGVN
jgi:hypothetical protein